MPLTTILHVGHIWNSVNASRKVYQEIKITWYCGYSEVAH